MNHRQGTVDMNEELDFKKIAPRNGSQSAAFEEFCCQIARGAQDVQSGSEFIRYRGVGGDGGVECIWRLPNGDEWGWQAKYIFDLSDAKVAVDKSIATAIRIHPRLTRYTICLPFDLTGPTGRKGKSQSEYFAEYRTHWESTAQTANLQMKVLLATPTTLLDDLLSFDPEGGRLRYWFDATMLGDTWFRDRLDEAKASAYPRYTPELRIDTPIAVAFEAFGLTDECYASLAGHITSFDRVLDDWKRSVATMSDEGWGAAFPVALRPDGEDAVNLLSNLRNQYCLIVEHRQTTKDIAEFAAMTDGVLQHFREIRVALAVDLEAKHGPGTANSAQFRQIQAEYHVRFPAMNIDAADKVITLLEAVAAWAATTISRLPGASELLILGQAGVGKTHALCDSAESRYQRGLRTLVLFGERFSGSTEPWEHIRQQLGFDATISREAMLAALDAAGEATGKPLLLSIDGLNETRPRTFWRAHLPTLISQARRYTWIRLCISCRSTYERQVIPAIPGLNVVVHEGFASIEFDACRTFFAHYQLEPPITPVLQPEFTNPLFLRLLCEAMVAAGHLRLPLGWHGINTAISAFVQAKNQCYAEEHDTHPNHRIPERGLKAFVSAAEAAKRAALPWSEANQAIESTLSVVPTQLPLIDWLIREGMLISDADPNSTRANAEDRVRIAFERLGDHLLAGKLLDGVANGDLWKAFDSDGPLGFAVFDSTSIQEHSGLIEALAVQLPERFGVELPDSVSNTSVRHDLIRNTVLAIPWRDPSRITKRTAEILRYALSLHDFAPAAFDAALAVCTYSSPTDAFWLHDVLAVKPMPQRDAFWCSYLHLCYEEHRPVEKLLRAAVEIDVDQVPVEIVERWATALLWFCAAPDRRIRDQATRVLVRITEPSPGLWSQLIERFGKVDDEYIVERCLAAAYGTLLRVRDPASEMAVAAAVFREVFVDSSRFQNATIRDYARSILELADYDEALPAGISRSDFMPPYTSEWPLDIPETEAIEQYRESNWGMVRLYHSW